MDDKHPSTSGEKRKSPCDTNYQNEQTQETPEGNSAPQPERDSAPQPERDSAPQPERDSAPQPVLKKIRIKVRYRNVKKIYSTQLENDQSREDTINPVQEEEERIREVVETPAKESEDPSVQAEDL
ncbi:sperm protein associated with the nucleus on the X chromosome N1-like [Pongo pygmaeus]|uniref:sperm protein associated with the nucleus on the X chromosome N1-like n=1 Tax=Pongo pygmaeus TaxID=9600 RepID=UPI0023E0C46E|nr:sperm protein associated with the nucleus on the X chromosome N1-like [Pongo pygmaeus]